MGLKWVLTTPQGWEKKEGGTKLPFFCGDVTDRSLRVGRFLLWNFMSQLGYSQLIVLQVPQHSTNTVHPNTAQSVAHLRLLAPVALLKTLSQELTAVLGMPPTAATSSEYVWQLHHPTKSFTTSTTGPRLILTASNDDNEAEKEFVRTHGPGLYEVAFRVADGKQSAVETPYGRIIFLPQ